MLKQRASVGRVQLMPDDAAAALHEQKKVANREADAARAYS